MQPDANSRSHPRSNVFLSAALIVGTDAVPVRLRNLSTRGALLDGLALPPAGSHVRVLRGELSAEGEIAWEAQGQAGLSFSTEINVNEWVRRIGHRGHDRADEAVAALRAHEPARLAGTSGSSTVAKLSRELNQICERLAGSPAMAVELAEELVRLNLLARELEQLTASHKS